MRSIFIVGLCVLSSHLVACELCHMLKCSACQILGEDIMGRLIDADSDKDRTVQVSHRLGKTGTGVKTTNYRDSELRVVEALDEICELTGVVVSQNTGSSEEPWRRFFSRGLQTTTTYSKEDKEFVKNGRKRLQWWCSEITTEYEDDFVALLKASDPDSPPELRTSSFLDALCNTTLGLCSGAAHETACAKAQKRYKKYNERVSRKTAEILEREKPTDVLPGGGDGVAEETADAVGATGEGAGDGAGDVAHPRDSAVEGVNDVPDNEL